ncbi:AMP-binding enzyme [delta proteobacterium NaphS2]|nr:AMP-binding enzyme [delta proteobacterium NaphS2]
MNKPEYKFERTEPETLSSMAQFTLPQILFKQAERLGSGKIAIREKAYGLWQSISWDAYFHYTKNTALGLMALGIERGETVALVLENIPECLFGELGTQTAGAIAVPLFAASTAETLANELNHVQAAYVFVQDQTQVDKLLARHQELPQLKQIIYVDPTGLNLYGDDPRLIAFSQLLELGEDLDNEQPDLFIKELWDGKPEDPAVMLKTSGTTDAPKLAMLSHANFTNAACRWVATESVGIGDDWISMCPMAWIHEQIWGVGIALCGGLTINFPERPETLLEDFIDIGPTIVTGSVGFWEDLASQIIVSMANSGKWHRILFDMALDAADRITRLKFREKPIPFQLKLKSEILRRIVTRPLLQRIGCDRIRTAYTGGHPISPEVIGIYRRLGLNMKQSYGLTETCGMIHVHPDGEVKTTSVGRPLPGAEIKLDPNREILIASGSNFMGYYRDPVLTATVLTDGWLHTGDAGYLDEDGHLVIIGRKHEMIETDHEPVSLDFVETRIKSSPYIQEVVISKIGEKDLSALIGLDFRNVRQWVEKRLTPGRSYADLARRPEVEEMIRNELATVNGRLPAPLRIEKFVLLSEPFNPDEREVTPTGKTRRKVIFRRHKKLFDAMLSKEQESIRTSTTSAAIGDEETLMPAVRVVIV